MPDPNKRVAGLGVKKADADFDAYVRTRVVAERSGGDLERELRDLEREASDLEKAARGG